MTLSRDKKYYFVATYPVRDPNREGWSVQVPSQTWWMLGIFAILCYGLARQLTSPLRKMQKTIERFGHGDFSARVNSRRADELGQLGRAVDQMAERIESLLKIRNGPFAAGHFPRVAVAAGEARRGSGTGARRRRSGHRLQSY